LEIIEVVDFEIVAMGGDGELSSSDPLFSTSGTVIQPSPSTSALGFDFDLRVFLRSLSMSVDFAPEESLRSPGPATPLFGACWFNLVGCPFLDEGTWEVTFLTGIFDVDLDVAKSASAMVRTSVSRTAD
jgi:hypothetical protein